MKFKLCANRQCRKRFEVEREGQTCCCADCAIAYASTQTEKIERKNRKIAKDKKKADNKAKREFKENELQYILAKTQKACNEWVRLRDRNMPCISCGTTKAKWDAGHYSNSTNSTLRFNTINLRKQCFRCNQVLSANLINYKANLIKLIGAKRVDQLDHTRGIVKWDKDYLRRMEQVFKKKIKAYKKRHDLD